MKPEGSPRRPVSEAEVERFWADGVVHLSAILPRDAVTALEAPVERFLADRDGLADLSDMASAFDVPSSGLGSARFLSGVDHWLDDTAFASFAIDSALPAIAAAVLRSGKINLYEDSVLVKEPGAVETTALHQDLAYFHVDGDQICTMWIPLDPVDRNSGAVHYVPGSHADGQVYRPNFFVSTDPLPGTEGDEVPPVPESELVWFDTEPGDVVVHHARTLHGATANHSNDRRRRAVSVRYCGDDARYRLRPGAPRKPHHHQSMDGTPLDHPRCPVVWPR